MCWLGLPKKYFLRSNTTTTSHVCRLLDFFVLWAFISRPVGERSQDSIDLFRQLEGDLYLQTHRFRAHMRDAKFCIGVLSWKPVLPETSPHERCHILFCCLVMKTGFARILRARQACLGSEFLWFPEGGGLSSMIFVFSKLPLQGGFQLKSPMWKDFYSLIYGSFS